LRTARRVRLRPILLGPPLVRRLVVDFRSPRRSWVPHDAAMALPEWEAEKEGDNTMSITRILLGLLVAALIGTTVVIVSAAPRSAPADTASPSLSGCPMRADASPAVGAACGSTAQCADACACGDQCKCEDCECCDACGNCTDKQACASGCTECADGACKCCDACNACAKRLAPAS